MNPTIFEFQNMQTLIDSWEMQGISKEEQLERIKTYITQSVEYYHQVGKKK